MLELRLDQRQFMQKVIDKLSVLDRDLFMNTWVGIMFGPMVEWSSRLVEEFSLLTHPQSSFQFK